MSDASPARMTVDDFLAWAETQPRRHELIEGRIFAMAPERARHADMKFAVQLELRRAIRAAGLACFMMPDGMTVRIDRRTAYEPDALVYCGQRLPGDAIEVPDPIIVVEVLSPGSGGTDKGAKLAGYFGLASVRHYLMIDPDRHVIVHHRRGEGDAIATRIVGSGTLRLDPPGLDLAVDALFGDDPPG